MITVVIFANTRTPEQAKMLNNLLSKIDDKYEIIIFEQSTYKAGKGKVIHKPEPFNFNKFCNDAMKEAINEMVLIANNDLEPQDGWIEALIREVKNGHLVVSSHDPDDPRQRGFTENQSGYECGKHFSGWCFMLHRRVWSAIRYFDEDFPFWCADNAFLEQLKVIKVIPTLVIDSKVKHLVSRTLRMHTKAMQQELTRGQIKKFNRKYNQNLFNVGK